MKLDYLDPIMPPVTEFNKPFWDGCAKRELRLQTCSECAAQWYPEGPCCPSCLSSNFTWKAVSGKGRVWSYVIMHQQYIAAYADETPYVVAMIELDEGPRLYCGIAGSKEKLACDAAVEVTFDNLGERFIPMFRLAPG